MIMWYSYFVLITQPFIIRDNDSESLDASSKSSTPPKALFNRPASTTSSIQNIVKIAVAGPEGMMMIEPPFAGYDLDPNIFTDLTEPPVFESGVLTPVDANESSDEYVKIERKDHVIRNPPFLMFNGRVFEPNALDEIGIPVVADGQDPTLNLVALRAFAVQILADNLGAVNVYLAALGLYKLGLDIGRSDESVLCFIQRNFTYCLSAADALCSGDETGEAAAESVIYARALELAELAGDNEGAGHSFSGCLVAYEQGIVLIEGLLDGGGVGEEERAGVEGVLKGLYERCECVRDKMG